MNNRQRRQPETRASRPAMTPAHAAPRNGAARRSGQALVEFSLISVLLITLLFGLLQYSWIYTATSQLTNITRDGVRYAAKHGTESTTIFNGTSMSTDAAIKSYIRKVATGTGIKPTDLPDGNITITPALGSGRSSGVAITVTIQYDMRKKLFVSTSFPGLSRFASMTQNSASMIIE